MNEEVTLKQMTPDGVTMVIPKISAVGFRPYRAAVDFSLDRAAAMTLRDKLADYLLTDYLDEVPADLDRKPAILFYHSVIGWRWIDAKSESAFGSRTFETGVAARDDLKSQGFYVPGED